jgi:hypothetical protein
MPKELTHWILADRAFAALRNDSRLRQVIAAHQAVYLGGAVLPDTLLHLLSGSHAAAALTLAHSFHDTAGNSFAPLILAEQRFPRGLPPALLACLLGVITHMEADIIFHPFVYAMTSPKQIAQHYQIETDIDVYFLQAGARPPVRHMADLLSPDSHETFISTCALLFDPEGTLPRVALEQALSLHCHFQAMYDHMFWKLLVRFLAITIGSPFREQRHLFYPLSHTATNILGQEASVWKHPINGELQRLSLEQLADEAVQRMVTNFERIESAGSLSDVLNNYLGENLLTGTHGVCLNNMTG